MDVSSVTTSDGTTIESNTDTQAELEAAVAAPLETPAPVEGAATDIIRDDTGRFKAKRTRRNDPIARMADATAKEAEAKRERDAAITERDKLAAELAAAKQPAVAPAPVQQQPQQPSAAPPAPGLPPATAEDWKRYRAMPNAPQPTQFSDPADYSVALTSFVTDVRFHELQSIHQAHQEDVARFTGAQQRAQTLYAKVTDGGKDPDVIKQMDPRLVNAPPLSALPRGAKPTFANFLIEQVYKSDHPKELLLHLSNEQEVQRLVTLPPDEVVRSLTLFDAALSRSPAAPVATGPAAPALPVSHAKPVFQPVAGSAPNGTSDDPPGDDASEAMHEAYWSKKRRQYR